MASGSVFSTSLATNFGRHGPGRTSLKGEEDTRTPEEKAAEEAERLRDGAQILSKLQSEIGVPFIYVQRNGYSDGALREASAALNAGMATYPSVLRAAHTVHRILEWRERRKGLPEIF